MLGYAAGKNVIGLGGQTSQMLQKSKRTLQRDKTEGKCNQKVMFPIGE
jgi:hypothetical protein